MKNEEELPEMIIPLKEIIVKRGIVEALSMPGGHHVEVPIERYERFGDPNDNYWRLAY